MMHVLLRDGLQDDDYLRPLLPRRDRAARARAERVSARAAWPASPGLPVADIEQFAHDYAAATRQPGADPPELRPAAARRRRHGGAHHHLPARDRRRLAARRRRRAAQHQQALPVRRPLPRTPRPDSARHAHHQHDPARRGAAGELPGPPVQALYVYNSNPAAVCPDQSARARGTAARGPVHRRPRAVPDRHRRLRRHRAAATTQLEHFDIHGSYGHLYVQTNEPAIAPLGEAKPQHRSLPPAGPSDGLRAGAVRGSDEELAPAMHAATAKRIPPRRRSTASRLERLRAKARSG